MSVKVAVGARVGAVLGAKQHVVKLLGYGVYEGQQVPPDTGPGSMTGLIAECGRENPKIRLDNGDVVWGCECWWGPEHVIQRKIEQWQQSGYTIVDVTIETFRQGTSE
jgi:hypothetical protein